MEPAGNEAGFFISGGPIILLGTDDCGLYNYKKLKA
jgi:hypothetical protein